MRRLAAVTATVALAAAGLAATASPAFADEAVGVTVSGPQKVDETLTVTATITGSSSCPGALLLTVTRSDSTGQHLLGSPQPGATDCTYTYADAPPVRGIVSYTVSDHSGVTAVDGTSPDLHITGLTPDLSLSANHDLVRSGTTVTLTGHVGSDTAASTVTFYATPYNRSRHTIRTADVDGPTDVAASYAVNRRTTFTLRFAGDSRYKPRTVSHLVTARAVVHDRLRGGFTTVNGYRLYHVDRNPRVVAHLLPDDYGRCLYFRAQRYRDGAWHNVATSTCVRTDSYGKAIGIFAGDHVSYRRYRVRAEWHGDTDLLAAHAPWLRLQFRP